MLGVLVILYFLNNYAENKIEESLDKNLKKVSATYTKIDVNLLGRKAEISDPEFKFSGKNLKFEKIEITKIRLWDYLVNKNIGIGELIISHPRIKIFKSQFPEADSTKTPPNQEISFDNKIILEKVSIHGGTFELFEQDTLNSKLYASIKEVILEEVHINSQTIKETVPFNYKLIQFKSDSLYYNLSDLHELMVDNLELENNRLLVSKFKIKPRYSKSEHQKHTPVENDRYNLEMDSILLSDLNWSLKNDSLNFQNPYTEIKGVDFKIYRDKLQPDDLTRKPMYSEMLRDLPIKLSLDSIKVKNMFLKYEENIKADRKPGVIDFDNLNATIYNVTNIRMNRKEFPKTKIKASSQFMNEASINLDWEFDISNAYDRFQASGNLHHLSGEGMNIFLKPAMNIEASGNIESMYFNFAGDASNATGDMILEYKDFKVEVLRKDGKQKNKILSALANLVVRNKAANKEARIKSIEVERDKTKSFWNYLWKCIESGALKSFL